MCPNRAERSRSVVRKLPAAFICWANAETETSVRIQLNGWVAATPETLSVTLQSVGLRGIRMSTEAVQTTFPPILENRLVRIERFSVQQMMEEHILPNVGLSADMERLLEDFIPAAAVFEGVRVDEAFDYLARTETLADWTLSLRNLRPFRGDIFVGDEEASPTGKVYIQTVADRGARTVGWNCSHQDPEDLWILYRGLLVDAEPALGRPGTACLWTNFMHERTKSDPIYAQGFKMMYAVHRLEIRNLKHILEFTYGAARPE